MGICKCLWLLPAECYMFEKWVGPVVFDTCGVNDLTEYNCAQVPGKHGNGAFFNGSNAYMEAASADGFHLTPFGSIEMWLKVDVLPTPFEEVGLILMKGVWLPVLNFEYLLAIWHDGTMEACVTDGFHVDSVDLASFPLGVWIHVVMTWDGEKVRVYLNGKVAGDAKHDIIVQKTGCTFLLGQRSGLHFFKGTLDSVRLYKEALNQWRVWDHYVSEK